MRAAAPALAFLLVAPAVRRAAAEPPRFSLAMAEAEAAARAHSLDLKAAAEQSAAAESAADAAFSPLLPRLTLDGYYRYQTEVPSLSIIPGQPAQKFGDHRATSIGPTLNWTLWDEGALLKTWRAQKAGARSQEEQERLVEAQTTQAARLDYVQVQLALERTRLLAESVAVADARYADVRKRLRAGAASRIDLLSSHQEDLQRLKDFLTAQSDLAAALRELFQMTGLGAGLDASRPLDARASPSGLPGLAVPTLLVSFDSLADTPAALAAAERPAGPSPDHPGVLAYERQAESARLSAAAESAGGWPVVQFSGAIAYEYPNGPVLQSVTQKSAGLTASMPLFETGHSARRADRQRHLAAAAERLRDLADERLGRDWDKARAALSALRDQQALDAAAVAESEELARLVYLSYQGGRSTYLEVLTYDLTALQAKVNAAQTRAQILIQLATLAQLGSRG